MAGLLTHVTIETNDPTVKELSDIFDWLQEQAITKEEREHLEALNHRELRRRFA